MTAVLLRSHDCYIISTATNVLKSRNLSDYLDSRMGNSLKRRKMSARLTQQSPSYYAANWSLIREKKIKKDHNIFFVITAVEREISGFILPILS